MTKRRLPTGRAGALLIPLWLAPALADAGDEASTRGWPSPREMTESLYDVWGEAALKLPGGPSFEAFRDLLPPLRYTNTRFRDYSVVHCFPVAEPSFELGPVARETGLLSQRSDHGPKLARIGTP